jgi:hypothetical protein
MAQLDLSHRVFIESRRLRVAMMRRARRELNMIRVTWPAVFLSLLGAACSRHDIAPTPSSTSAPRALALAQSLQRQAKAGSKPVRIVQGEFVFPDNSHGTASLQGTAGFRFDPHIGDGSFPGSQCIVTTLCVPGAMVTLHGEWAGLDLAGGLVWRGTTYPAIEGGLMTLTGQFVAPPHGGDMATITVPFVLTGFVEPELDEILPVEGSGTATLELVWDTSFGNGGTWAILRSRYEFNGAHGA